MSKEKLRELCQGTLDAIEAHDRGEAVQYSAYGEGWADCDGEPPVWHDNLFYRPKPKPRECWLSLWGGYLGAAHETKEDAMATGADGAIHMREVMPGED